MVSRILKLKYLALRVYQLENGEDVGWVYNCACVTLEGPIVRLDNQPIFLMEITQMTFPGQPIFMVFMVIILIQMLCFLQLFSTSIYNSFIARMFRLILFPNNFSLAVICWPIRSMYFQSLLFKRFLTRRFHPYYFLSLGEVCILVYMYKHCWPGKDVPSYSKALCSVHFLSFLYSNWYLTPWNAFCEDWTVDFRQKNSTDSSDQGGYKEMRSILADQ